MSLMLNYFAKILISVELIPYSEIDYSCTKQIIMILPFFSS